MAARSNVWMAMYGGSEDEYANNSKRQLHPQPEQTATNHRRFLSARPPFATDDEIITDTVHPETSMNASSTLDLSQPQLPSYQPDHMGNGHAQRSREIFGSASGSAELESSAKRKKAGTQSAAITRHLYRTEENPSFTGDKLTTNPGNNQKKDYGSADRGADLADVDEFAFWNDMQRCETLLGALSSNLEICKENMNTDLVAKMASELEKVASVLNQMP